MRIAMGVHGRFHAFELAKALWARGEDVTLFTNYPAFALKRFGVDSARARTCPTHGVLVRLRGRLDPHLRWPGCDAMLHRMFGRWLRRVVTARQWDVSYTWSGVSEELLRAPSCARTRLLVRGSAHIRTQLRLLTEEEERTGAPQEKPHAWTVAREEREYDLADAVVTLSTFSRRSFLEEGVAANRVKLMVAGAPVRTFRATQKSVEERCRRLTSQSPLQVLTVGTFSYRKGVQDLARITEALPRERFVFRFVGTVAGEAVGLAKRLGARVEFMSRLAQADLPGQYAWGDLFLFPTIEDGFPQVMAQSCAAALPQLTTPNGAGTDLVRDGINGWVLPIRSPEQFIARLRWCDAHREELADMVRRCANSSVRDWADAAEDLVAIVEETRHT